MFESIVAGDAVSAGLELDLFWARLAMHIRAEHLHLFPAVLTRRVALATTLSELRNHHDFFMHELAAAMKKLRTRGTSALTAVRATLQVVNEQLKVHDAIEEEEVYRVLEADAETTTLAISVLAELTNLPPRFTAGGLAIDGFVLAGGASSRMGSDKADLAFGKTTLAGRAYETLSGVAPHVSIIGGRVTGGTSLADVYRLGGESKASLIGLHSALFHAKSPWVAVLACDMPFVGAELFRRLITIAEITGDGFDAVVPQQRDRRLQPLAAIYRREPCLSAVEAMLDANELRLTEVLRRLRAYIFEPAMYSELEISGDLFFNINTPDDLASALRKQ